MLVVGDGQPAGQGLADRADHLLGAAHHAVVVGVRLVELELRELGVVLEADALVAEVAADLVDPLEAAHDQPLQVQLEADAQEQLLFELVVERGERPRGRAAVNRLEDRGLDFEEAVRVQVAAHGGDQLGPRAEHLAHFGIRQ